jgi:hypothetical protein
MEKLPTGENQASRDRLTTLVGGLSRAQLRKTVDGERTVSQILAQLAFWDRWAEQLLFRWRTGVLPPPSVPDWYDSAINAALADQWRALPNKAVVELVQQAAKSVDREISHIETPVLVALTASKQMHLLNRHEYRNAALDEIDQTLGGKR